MEPTPSGSARRGRSGSPEVLRASIEIGACAIVLIVALTLLGVVLHHAHSAEQAAARHGRRHARARTSRRSIPALAQTPEAWELEYATCAKLLNYPPRVGYRGTRLVPEVAASLPASPPTG